MKRIFLSIILLSGVLTASAQTMSTTYFLDHDNYRYRINPSLMPDDTVKATFGLMFDNIVVAPQSNIGLSSFLFPVDGTLVSGFNKKISSEKFLGGLNAKNLFDLGTNHNLLTVGFRTDPDGFGTIELNARTNSYIDIPKELFAYLKTGSARNTYKIENFSASTVEIAELAFGYSRRIGDFIQLGARAKLLCGLARADVVARSMALAINSSAGTVDVKADGSLDIYTPLITIGTKQTSDGKTVYDLSAVNQGKFGVSGFGVAFDLGVSAYLFDGLELSLSAQDIGGLNWKRSVKGTLSSEATIKLENSDLGKALSDLFNFVPESSVGSNHLRLPCIYRLGARYSMPFYERLSVGILGTLETGDHYNYNELRTGVTLTPVDQISLTANYGATSYGSTMGAAVNFNLGPIQLFIGTDSVIFEYTPQGLPVRKLNSTVNFGLLVQIKKS